MTPRSRTFAALALALVTLSAAASCSSPAAFAAAPGETPHRRTLTVTGTATLDLTPDCADVSLTLTTNGERPKIAITLLRKKQEQLIKSLVTAGVKSSDIKISALNLNQTFDPKGRPTGYAASITVIASTTNFDLVGDIMDAASDVGTQNMYTTFRVSDLPSYKKKVRTMALKAAAEKAKDTVAALDAALGKVSDITEVAMDWHAGAMENSYSVEVRGGAQLNPELKPLTLSVTVTYELA